MLANAIAASTHERQRIAADLHDGVVQDLAGVAFGLAPLAAGASQRGDDTEAEILRDATGAEGIATALEVDDERNRPAGTPAQDALVYRAAREAIRNSQKHARPSAVTIAVRHDAEVTRMTVTDDGVGFSPEDRSRRGQQGHVGLTLLDDVVAQAGGTLTVHSVPAAGTTVTLELPTA